MATKKQLSEQAMRIIAGGHRKPDNPIDIREVMLHCDQIRDELVRISTQATKSVDAAYISYYDNVTVNVDSLKLLRYIDLPGNPMSLPDDMGIYSISPMGDTDNQYIPLPPSSTWLYKDTQANLSTNITKYWNVGGKIYFKNIDPTISTVLVGLAASSKDILENANYPVPPDVEKEIVRQLVQMFGIEQQAPHDETENGQKNG
jgi:hypothetical protein